MLFKLNFIILFILLKQVNDQPDVYETSDLPESDQDLNSADNGDTTDSVVEILNVSGENAYSTFKGKVLDSSMVDFSDRISRRGHTGYSSRWV